MAGRAGSFQGKEALGMASLAVAAAGWAGLGLGASFGAGSRAGLAGDRGWNADLGGLAPERLFERDLHVVAQIGAALAPGAAAAAPGHAEQVVENISECRGKIGPEPGTAGPRPLLEGGVSIAVVGAALVGVLENVIGLVDFLEMLLTVLIAGIAIGMELHGELTERGFDLRVARAARYAQHIVIVALRHYRHASPR